MGIIQSLVHYLQSSFIIDHQEQLNNPTLDDVRADIQQRVMEELELMELCTNCYINRRVEKLIMTYLHCQHQWQGVDLPEYLRYLKNENQLVQSLICEHLGNDFSTIMAKMSIIKDKLADHKRINFKVISEEGDCICMTEQSYSI